MSLGLRLKVHKQVQLELLLYYLQDFLFNFIFVHLDIELLFCVKNVKSMSKWTFLQVNVHWFQCHMFKKDSLCSIVLLFYFVKCWLAICMWIYFWVPYSDPKKDEFNSCDWKKIPYVTMCPLCWFLSLYFFHNNFRTAPGYNKNALLWFIRYPRLWSSNSSCIYLIQHINTLSKQTTLPSILVVGLRHSHILCPFA